ncbi:unnamed protein product [Cuscuta europaea]|uniref:Uncharacterized protein n=1 Tax=Cuscuta europaea TaxID=41803 RepID=A0A9P0Z7K4_CUSEU|nr:unnamed protein product [Cuscuta europaea]
MATSLLPRTIIQKIEKKLSKFLWDNLGNNHKHVWRAWRKCCYPVNKNGLGLRSLHHIQKTFFLELHWKIKTTLVFGLIGLMLSVILTVRLWVKPLVMFVIFLMKTVVFRLMMAPALSGLIIGVTLALFIFFLMIFLSTLANLP